MYHIFIIEDENSLREAEKKFLEKCGYLVNTYEDGESAINDIKKILPEVVFLDIKLPKKSGIEILKEILAINKNIHVIMVSAYSDFDNVLKSMKYGAFDFIKKPFELNELLIKVENAIENLNLLDKINYFHKSKKEYLYCPSKAMKNVYKKIDKITNTPGNTTVLITGESGTGKEIIAHLIHNNTPYSKGEFVELNCSSIPATLLESELFGHVKGAFTDAISNKKGLFLLANEGTLFLDEIGDMPLELQGKLLKVLETKKIKPIGSERNYSINLRIITATNKNLEKMVKDGKFRQDLFYRLNVFPITISPLRNRKDDIIPLAEYFIKQFNKIFKKHIIGLTEKSKKILLKHNWPGNVRELKNIIERYMIITEGDYVEIEDFTPTQENIKNITTLPDNGIDLEAYISNIEKQLIISALNKTGWNQTQAAQLLNIPREILRYRLKKYKIK